MLCREKSLVKKGDGWGIAIPLMCRSWGCDYCAPIRKRQVVAQAASGQANRMITLTVNPHVGKSPEARAARLARAWRVIVARCKRRYGWDKLEYFAVFEATKKGEPHLHVLCRCPFIEVKWLSEQMRGLMRAPNVWVSIVKSSQHAAFYVSKYIGKKPQHFGTCKRYWHTKNWEVNTGEPTAKQPQAGDRWRVDERDLPTILHAWTKAHLNPQPFIPFNLVYEGSFPLGSVFYGRPPGDIRSPDG